MVAGGWWVAMGGWCSLMEVGSWDGDGEMAGRPPGQSDGQLAGQLASRLASQLAGRLAAGQPADWQAGQPPACLAEERVRATARRRAVHLRVRAARRAETVTLDPLLETKVTSN